MSKIKKMLHDRYSNKQKPVKPKTNTLLSEYRSVPTQNLNWGFSYPFILKLEGM